MKIEFGVQEYFNELKLMDAQYGQEEELYPWIYMLLQMAECRKKEILKEWYQEVSIRDVHKGQKAKGDSELKKKLYSIGGFPDIAIFNMEATRDEGGSLLGCVEIKKYESVNLEKPLILMKEKEECKKLKIEKKEEYHIRYVVNSKIECETLNCTENELDDIIINKIGKEYNFKNQNQSNRYYETYSENNKGEDEGEKYKDIEIELENSNNTHVILATVISEHIENLDYEFEKPDKWNIIDKDQIIKHLYKAKNVLYTNGLEFYFLTLEEVKKQITIMKLADLSSVYNRYLEHNEKYIELKDDAEEQWNDLIAGLTYIDWHKEPVAEIPSAQPSTEE